MHINDTDENRIARSIEKAQDDAVTWARLEAEQERSGAIVAYEDAIDSARAAFRVAFRAGDGAHGAYATAVDAARAALAAAIGPVAARQYYESDDRP